MDPEIHIADLRGENLEREVFPEEIVKVLENRSEPSLSEEELSLLREYQLVLSAELKLEDRFSTPKYFIGFDLTFLRGEGSELALGGGAVFLVEGNYATPFGLRLRLIKRQVALTKIRFPYIPTFLAFRELPTLIALYRIILAEPDIREASERGELIVFIDGQGIAHPRGLGIASHFGVLTESPSIGCAKRKLWGRFKNPSPGRYEPLLNANDQLIGFVLRPGKSKKLLFISPGNMITPETSLTLTLRSVEALGYPPTHSAHLLLQKVRRELTLSS